MTNTILSPGQTAVMEQFHAFMLSNTIHEMVIAGFPGTGKSFLTKYLIDMVEQKAQLSKLIGGTNVSGVQIVCTATTNKAAKILAEMTGRECITIHSYLKLRVQNDYQTGKTKLVKGRDHDIKEGVLILIDEGSYINKSMLKVIRDSTIKCKILYVGDEYQLVDINESECPVFTDVPHKATLTESQRFADNGPIDLLAAQFRKSLDTGVFTPIVPDGVVIKHVDGPTFQTMVDAEFKDINSPENHAKMLAWSNATVLAYNKHIRSLHTQSDLYEVGETVVTNNPISHRGRMVYSIESRAKVTDVSPGTEHGIDGAWLMLDNTTKIFQALDQTQVTALLKVEAKNARGKGNWVNFFHYKEFFADLRPIHAATVYKAQGSTYDRVFIDLTDIGRCNIPSNVARMLHVAVTRASQEVILYGVLPAKYTGD